MNNIYKKQEHNVTDKWGNIVNKKPKNKQNDFNDQFKNNPFKEFFKGVKFETTKEVKK